MTHHHISRVLYVIMVAVFITTGLVIFAYAQIVPAQADQAIQPIVVYCVSPKAVAVYEITAPNSNLQAPCQYPFPVTYQSAYPSPQVLGAATTNANSSVQTPSSHLSWDQAVQKYVLTN